MSKSNQNINIVKGASFDLTNSKISEYRMKWENNPKQFIVEPYPLHLDIEITNHCNLKCSFCASTIYDYEKKGFMSFELFQKIIDESSEMNLYALKLNWRGEPLLHKQVIEMVKYAKSKNIPDVFINTNGYFLDSTIAENLIDAGIDRIILSFEGCTSEVYEKYRVGSDFNRVYENIKLLSSLKKQKKSNTPYIRVQSVCVPEMQDNIENYKKLWSEIADEISIIDYRDELSQHSDNSLFYDEWQCPYLWLRLTISYDGLVYPCCFVTKNSESYGESGVLGNVNTSLISSIWNDDTLREYRLLHKKGESQKISICKVCSYRDTELQKNIKGC
ncbi:MAG: radical SAM protein [Defluviitaleaceae bacterium]|nr:radical SAM protein [Defluviitaleaceae bacterium]